MTWVKLDDGYFRNPKARALGKDGRALHLASLCWCAANLTDGIIRHTDLPLLLAEAQVKRATVKVLVTHRAWVEHPEGWVVHDFLTYNRSAESVRAERDEAAERMRRNREKRERSSPPVRANNARSSPVRSPYPDPTRPDPTSVVDPDDNSEPVSRRARSSSSIEAIDLEPVLELIVAGLAHEAGKLHHQRWQQSTRTNQRNENGSAIISALLSGEKPDAIAARFCDPVHIRLALKEQS